MTLEMVQGGSRPEKQCWGGTGQAPVTLLLVPPSLALGSTPQSANCSLLSQVWTGLQAG